MIQPIQVYRGVWRGPQPKTDEDWALLQSLNVEFCLDLQTGSEILGDGSPLEEQLKAQSFGIKSFAHPLGWILPPSRKELNLARAFIVTHKPVYVHCKTGVDRTGMVIGDLTSSDDDPASRKAAIKKMKEMGMHFWYAFWWPYFL